jgi:hypothetical protein
MSADDENKDLLHVSTATTVLVSASVNAQFKAIAARFAERLTPVADAAKKAETPGDNSKYDAK